MSLTPSQLEALRDLQQTFGSAQMVILERLLSAFTAGDLGAKQPTSISWSRSSLKISRGRC